MGEHLLDVQGVRGSSPLVSTIVCAPVAQRIAHLIPIQKVTGSIPVGRAMCCLEQDEEHLGSALTVVVRGSNFKSCRTDYGAVAQLEEHNAGSVGVEGSSPFSSTNKNCGDPRFFNRMTYISSKVHKNSHILSHRIHIKFVL